MMLAYNLDFFFFLKILTKYKSSVHARLNYVYEHPQKYFIGTSKTIVGESGQTLIFYTARTKHITKSKYM